MSKLDGTRRQRKCFSHYESMINGRKSPKYDCIVLVLTLLVTIKEMKVIISNLLGEVSLLSPAAGEIWVLGCVVTISLDNDVLAGDSSSTSCPVPGVRLWFVGTMGRSLGRGQSS